MTVEGQILGLIVCGLAIVSVVAGVIAGWRLDRPRDD